ncbi:CapA family protein [Streptomyces aidingensis]|uniref:Poly-gamma-glutamate synthesis protein (Capsule biosynthesis protein) n=1 Tax=Streptomyces aidingensis TaxID=910347 RepID=A0A1I1UZM8_9ACTN|nr:CapA family protein [Streptomyces aidingensis]SFD76104.1 poly-gamma-glutamate synthesis protein (capsule biosynthesis protein) [Streptomyces aidingensis]
MAGSAARGTVGLALCGDVMLGRGIDQILPHPGDPALREPYVRDARGYVALAEDAAGVQVPHPAPPEWPWGEALRAMDEQAPDAVRLLNLETSVTTSADFEPGKGIHYRMHPANLPCLAAARPDVCVLANNHVLDFGRRGLAETLEALAGAGLRTAGAGRDADRAGRPAAVPLPADGGTPRGQRGQRGRVLVFALAMPSAGVPLEWGATARRAGVDFLPGPSAQAADVLAHRIGQARRPGDLVVVSLHWGSNWGWEIPPDHVTFAHALIDGGADVVHGHSSHHPRPPEVYRGKLVLYGCGDLVNDYEGIAGYEEFRDDLRLCHLARLEPDTGRLAELRMVPLRARGLRLEHASGGETEWLRRTLTAAARPFGTHLSTDKDGNLALHR